VEVEVEEGDEAEAADGELPDVDRLLDVDEVDDAVQRGYSSKGLQSSSSREFMTGHYIIAKYDYEWYVAQVV
jgi:hypothetical protein